jgi:metal-sulfur cluster biosynthetic enzyme
VRNEAMNDDILLTLKDVIDPELGISIVDLGLVYHAAWSTRGIEVALTMTTPSCPWAEMLVRKAEQALHERFREIATIRVELVWEPPWSPERISEQGRRQLGWSTAAETKRNALS